MLTAFNVYTESIHKMSSTYTLNVKCQSTFCRWEGLFNLAEAKFCGKAISMHTDHLYTTVSTYMLNIFNIYIKCVCKMHLIYTLNAYIECMLCTYSMYMLNIYAEYTLHII